ncbi:MAG TPA: hypothetical protein VGJ73_05655 [Verrucomicrobiae bacterium]
MNTENLELKSGFSAGLLFGSELFGRGRFVAAFGFMFRLAGGFRATGFFAAVFLAVFRFAARFFPGIFRTPIARLLVARGLDSAEGAAEIFDLAFVTEFLFFRQLNDFQNVLHLFEGFFERFHDPAHIIDRPGKRGRSALLGLLLRMLLRARVLLMARPLNDRWSIGGFWLRFRLRLGAFGAFNGRGYRPRLFMRMFFRRRRRLNGSGCRPWRRGGMGRTQAASTTAPATTSAAGWAFPRSGLIQFRLMFIRHFQNKVGVPAAKSNK